jgi:hypothetical protein|tara:strand:- start:519 stop:725 length:207 start_codon:yes stop_codon:yes gene_type:complete
MLVFLNKIKTNKMPNYGEQQMPAGKVLNTAKPIVGTRVMQTNNSTIMPTLRTIDNVPYKGNAVLNAQK